MAKILVIEDDPYVRDYYNRLFRLGKHDVSIVADGEEGLAEVKKNRPELILLDIMMPGENGLQVLQKLKEKEETEKIVVVMLTNLEDDSSRQKAKDLGADGYLIKSEADPQTLLDAVDRYLKN